MDVTFKKSKNEELKTIQRARKTMDLIEEKFKNDIFISGVIQGLQDRASSTESSLLTEINFK